MDPLAFKKSNNQFKIVLCEPIIMSVCSHVFQGLEHVSWDFVKWSKCIIFCNELYSPKFMVSKAFRKCICQYKIA